MGAGTSPAQPIVPTDTVPPKPDDPPAEGMVSWFKSALEKLRFYSLHDLHDKQVSLLRAHGMPWDVMHTFP